METAKFVKPYNPTFQRCMILGREFCRRKLSGAKGNTFTITLSSLFPTEGFPTSLEAAQVREHAVLAIRVDRVFSL